MEHTRHIITGSLCQVDTRLLENSDSKIHITMNDLHGVSVIGIPIIPLMNYFETHPKTIDQLNCLLKMFGNVYPFCSIDYEKSDVFIVTQSETVPPQCIKLFGTNDFVIVTLPEYDGIRFSIYKDVGRTFNIKYTHSNLMRNPNEQCLTSVEPDTTKIQVVQKDGFSSGGAG